VTDPFRREAAVKEIAEVNIVPLADVSLVLLILLMVLSPMMTQDMLRVQAAAQEKEPPADQAPPPPASQEAKEMVLVVALHASGMSIGDNFFRGPGEFIPYMTSILAVRTDKKVFLAPDAPVPTGLVVNMIETLKRCGASSVALVQSAEGGNPPLPPAAGGR